MELDRIQDKFLWHIAMEGAKNRYGMVDEEILGRMKSEMEVITGNKFTDYILIIWDMLDFCRTPNKVFTFCAMNGITPPPDGIIPIGPGRGSVGGSIICYNIGIHDCDPIKFGLFFERFLNDERIAFPDIDLDISRKYRHVVLSYVADKYGNDKVSQIITFSTLSAKSVNEEVLKTANVPMSVINAVKATISDDPTITMNDLENSEKYIKAMQSIVFPDTTIIVDTTNIGKIVHTDNIYQEDLPKLDMIRMGVTHSADIRVRSSWDYMMAIDIMKRLEKLSKHESVHSGGILVSPITLNENIPLMRRAGTGPVASQYDMRLLEDLGYIKIDALGLRTVDVNHDAERLVKRWYDPDFDITKVPYDDKNALDLLLHGDTIGIFQIESSGFTQMMQQIFRASDWNEQQREFIDKVEGISLDIKDFMWIVAGLAMYRPGPLDAIIEGKTMVDHLIDRKAGKEPVTYLFPEEQDYLGETYGVMIYQEQVMARVRQMTGCTLGRADMLRKAMGKKNEVLMKQEMDWFEQAAMNHDFTMKDISEQQKRDIIHRAKEEIDKFARYGFNKAHAVEYGHICYRNAYYKANYPVAFYTALLNSELDNNKRQSIIIKDMIKHDIALLPPLINESELDFTMTDKDTLRFGLGAISGLGKAGATTIINDRAENGQFGSMEEFRVRIPGGLCNVNVLTNLAKCGAFDSIMKNGIHGDEIINRATLVEIVPGLNDVINKAKRKKGKNKPAPTFNEVMAKINSGALQYELIVKEEDKIEYAIWEKKILNFFISAHPIDAYKDEINRWGAISDTELEDLPSEFYIAGFVADSHETTIKKEGRNKGKVMGFVTVETEFMSYDATLFPGLWESCLPYIKAGNPVILKGKRDSYRDNVSIQGMYMRHMVNSGIRDCPECHIIVEDNSPMKMLQLKQMFDEHPGNTEVYLHISTSRYDVGIMVGQTVAINDRIIEFCDNEIGRLVYKL